MPDEVLELYRRCIPRGERVHAEWVERFSRWDGDKARWQAAQAGHGLPGWEAKLPTFEPDDGPLATRRAIKACLDATGEVIPGLVPGSADLTGNTGMAMDGAVAQSVAEPGRRPGPLRHPRARDGRVMTGMAAHGGILPVGGTFFVFSDYMRGAVRVAAVSNVHVVYSWTHDSIGLGQDGPTHQPIEQLAAVRAMPNLRVIRPADANETVQAWRIAVDHDGPTALILSRQSLPVLAETVERAAEGVSPRAPTCSATRRRADPELVLVGTGSEVHVCLAGSRPARGRAGPRSGSCPSRRGSCSPRSPLRTGTGSSPRVCHACRSRRRPPSGGSATPTRASASTTSVRPRPAIGYWTSSASIRNTSWSERAPCSRRDAVTTR